MITDTEVKELFFKKFLELIQIVLAFKTDVRSRGIFNNILGHASLVWDSEMVKFDSTNRQVDLFKYKLWLLPDTPPDFDPPHCLYQTYSREEVLYIQAEFAQLGVEISFTTRCESFH